MEAAQFAAVRKQLGFTQEQLSRVLLISLKTVRSYEQGWRSVPQNMERQMMLLASMRNVSGKGIRSCWDVKKCAVEGRRQCPAWQLKAGHFCWFINGTVCEGETHGSWDEKIKICRKCDVFPGDMTAFEGTRPRKTGRSK